MPATIVTQLGMEWIPCQAHILHLAFKKPFKGKRAIHSLVVVFSRVTCLTGYLHKSSRGRDELSKLQEKFGLPLLVCPQHCEVRWCSALIVIKFVLENEKAIRELRPPRRTNPDEPTPRFPSGDDFDFLRDVYDLFAPVKQVMKILELQYNNVGMIAPMIMFLSGQMSPFADASKDPRILQIYKTFSDYLRNKMMKINKL